MTFAVACTTEIVGPWLVLTLSTVEGRVQVAVGEPDANGFAPATWVVRDADAGLPFVHALLRAWGVPTPPSEGIAGPRATSFGAALVVADPVAGRAKLCFGPVAELYLSWSDGRAELREKDPAARDPLVAALLATVGLAPAAEPPDAPTLPRARPAWEVDPTPLLEDMVPVAIDGSALRAAWIPAGDGEAAGVGPQGGFVVVDGDRARVVALDGSWCDLGPAPTGTSQVAWVGGRAWFAHEDDNAYAIATLAPGEDEPRAVSLVGHDALQRPFVRTEGGLVVLVHARDRGGVLARSVSPTTLRTRALAAEPADPAERTVDGDSAVLGDRTLTLPGSRTVRVQRVQGGHVVRSFTDEAWLVDTTGRGSVAWPAWLGRRAATRVSDDARAVLVSTDRGDLFVGRLSDRWRTGAGPTLDRATIDERLAARWTGDLLRIAGRTTRVSVRRACEATGLAADALPGRVEAAVRAQVERDSAAIADAARRWVEGDAAAAATLAAMPAVGPGAVLLAREADGSTSAAAAEALVHRTRDAAVDRLLARLDLPAAVRLLTPRARVPAERVAAWLAALERAEAAGAEVDEARRRLSEPDGVEVGEPTLARLDDRFTRLARLLDMRAPGIIVAATADDIHTALAADP